MTNPLPGVRWLWMLLGGFLAELALVAISVVFYGFVPGGAELLLYVAPPACLVATFAVGLWIVRKAKSRFVLNGAILGLVAALLYIPAFFNGEPIAAAYLVAEALKVIGGAAAGFVIARGATRATPSVG